MEDSIFLICLTQTLSGYRKYTDVSDTDRQNGLSVNRARTDHPVESCSRSWTPTVSPIHGCLNERTSVFFKESPVLLWRTEMSRDDRNASLRCGTPTSHFPHKSNALKPPFYNENKPDCISRSIFRSIRSNFDSKCIKSSRTFHANINQLHSLIQLVLSKGSNISKEDSKELE